MKNSIVAIFLLLIVNLSAQSADKFVKNRAFWNPITIYNDSDYAIIVGLPYLQINLPTTGDFYLKPGTKITVYSTFGTHGIQLAVGACLKKDQFDYCLDLRFGLSPEYYDLELVKTIHIYSVYDYKITCLDGTTTSCIVHFDPK